MSKKMSKIRQSRVKLKMLKKIIEDGKLGKLKPRKMPASLKFGAAMLLFGITVTYSIAIYNFFS